MFADLKAGPLAHLPSKSFNANGAWLALATMAFNLTRAPGVTAGGRYRRAQTAGLRAPLIHTPPPVAPPARAPPRRRREAASLQRRQRWLWTAIMTT